MSESSSSIEQLDETDAEFVILRGAAAECRPPKLRLPADTETGHQQLVHDLKECIREGGNMEKKASLTPQFSCESPRPASVNPSSDAGERAADSPQATSAVSQSGTEANQSPAERRPNPSNWEYGSDAAQSAECTAAAEPANAGSDLSSEVKSKDDSEEGTHRFRELAGAVTAGDDADAKPDAHQTSMEATGSLSSCSMSDSVDILADHSMFHRVMYLGAASVNAPRSEAEIQRNMAILNAAEQGRQAIPVCVAVPTTPQGSVVSVPDHVVYHQ